MTCIASPLSALAFGMDNPDYDQCILQSLRNSQSSMAADAIRRSCEAIYRNGELLLPRERSYHVCVLQNLQGVRDGFAVQQMHASMPTPESDVNYFELLMMHIAS
jgi:hypothetical protein